MMDLREAQLFRILSAFFGADRVLFQMSILCVCNGQLPQGLPFLNVDGYSDINNWASKNKCLFTIVDEDDNPKLVIDFIPEQNNIIDIKALDVIEKIPVILNSVGIKHLTMSSDEMNDIIDPAINYDIVKFLEERLLKESEEL